MATLLNCQYRFMHDGQRVYVYVIRKQRLVDTQFYTRPYYSQERGTVTNVLVACVDPSMSFWDTKSVLDDPAISHECMPLLQAKEIAKLLKMPMIVHSGSFCDTRDFTEGHFVYYFDTKNLSSFYR